MTARMLLSLFLDFFRCRKSLWHRATIKRAETNSNLDRDLDPNLYTSSQSTGTEKPDERRQQTGMEVPQVLPQLEEATCNVQRAETSCESDYDSVRNLELQLNSEPDDDYNDNDNDCYNTSDQQTELKVEADADVANVDVEEFGFDDPRLPEMII